MRKFLPQIMLLTIVLFGIGLFVVPAHAHAETCGLDVSCYFIGSTDIVYGLIGKIFWWVLIPIGSIVLGLLGTVIDGAVNLSLDPSFYNSEAIGIAWSVVRDIANMVFIFVLIAEGIKTILSLGNMNTVKRTITSIVIAALLLNFSLFFTKVFIDVSNTASAWLVQGINNIGGGSSMSDSVRATLQMEKLTKSVGKGADAKTFTLQSFTQGFLLLMLTLVAVYVFFKMTFLIIGRLVAFLFLLITSPIGFTGIFLELGDVSTYAKKWWSEMSAQAFMLPMFFLMLYLTLFIVDRMDTLVFSSAATTDFAPANYVIFIIIIMMLLQALKIAEDYSGELGKMASGYLKTATGVALGGFSAVGGVLARQTAGRYAFNYTQDKGKMGALTEQASKGGLAGFGARMQLAATNKAASGSFDARNTSAGSGLIGSLGAKAGIGGLSVDASKVGKTEGGGYKAGVDEFKKAEEKWAKDNLGKGKAGEVNRMTYAEMRQNDSLHKALNAGVSNPRNILYADKLAGKTGAGYKSSFEDISENAYKAYARTDKEGAEKDAQKVKNYIIDNQIAVDMLKKAGTATDAATINKSAGNATAQLDEFIKKSEKEVAPEKAKIVRGAETLKVDLNKKLADAYWSENKEETERLTKEVESVEEILKTASDEDRKAAAKLGALTPDEIGKAHKKYLDRVTKMRGEVEAVKKDLKAAQEEGDLLKKKQTIEAAIKNIEAKIIGQEGKKGKKGQDWQKDANGNPIIDIGLKGELRRKKAEVKNKQDESKLTGMDGGGDKGGGDKGGGGGDGGGKKDKEEDKH